MDFIKILVNGTNQEIKRKYFKLEDSQNICYFDIDEGDVRPSQSGGRYFPFREVKMVNLEDGFAIKNNELITSPPILKIRGTIIDVRMDTDSNLILVDSVEVSTSTAYTTVFEPYKNTDYLVYINSYVIDFQKSMKKIKSQPNNFFLNQNKPLPKSPKYSGRERVGNLPAGWTAIQNGNTLNLVDIAFDGGADATATHNLYAIASDHKFYQLNIKLDGSVNTPITGNTIWSELTEINTDLASFFANGFGPSSTSILSAYGGVLILNFYSSNGFTLPIFISLNRESVPDWLSNFPLASNDNRFKFNGVTWPSYVRVSNDTTFFVSPMIMSNNVGGKIGIADINIGNPLRPVKAFTTLQTSSNPAFGKINPVIDFLVKKDGTFTGFGLLNPGSWGELNNIFIDSTSYIIDSQSPANQTNGIFLIDWQDSSFRYIQFWKLNNSINLVSLGSLQIPMGLGVLQFAAFNGVMFCLTTSGLYFMRYIDTIDGTTPIPSIVRCCETGTCGSTTLLTNQLNIWTDCSAGQVCNYTGKDTCPAPSPPPGPKPTPSPSPSNQGFFTRIWNWLKKHWIISLTTVAVLILIFILIIFIAVKSKQSSSLSNQFNQNLEVLEQQKLASLLQPSSTVSK